MTYESHNGRSVDPANAPTEPVEFFFEGRRMQARSGDSLAKALAGNRVTTLGHSVKFGRPRGVMCARGRCSACLVEVDREPGVKACVTPVRAGMRVVRQDFKPAYGFLLTAAIRYLPFPAGFYFRFFPKPKLVREMFLATLRGMAGVGRVDPGNARELTPAADDPGRLARLKPHYDIVVVGAGLSGLAATAELAPGGRDILWVNDYYHEFGHGAGPTSDDLGRRRGDMLATVARQDNVTRVFGTTAQGFYPPNELLLEQDFHTVGPEPSNRAKTRVVTANHFIFATGDHDVVPLFANNDLPGVFGERALRLLLTRDGWIPGRRALAIGDSPGIQRVRTLLEKFGVSIATALTVGDASSPRLLSADGDEWVQRVRYIDETGAQQTIGCDLVVAALPGQPAFELPQQAGFGYTLSDDARPDMRVMIPNERTITTDTSSCHVIGGAAGIRDRNDRVSDAVAVARRLLTERAHG